LPGIEVLSRCPDDVTERLLSSQHQLRSLLTLILPEDLQGRGDVPEAYVLDDAAYQTAMTRDMLAALEQQHAGPADSRAWHLPGIRSMPNFRFSDQDSLAVFFTLGRVNLDSDTITLTPNYIQYLLATRNPALPPWFILGLTRLYQMVELSAPAAVQPMMNFRSMQQQDLTNPSVSGCVTIQPFVWLSEAETRRLRKKAAAPVAFLPLATLFSDPRPQDRPPADQELLATEAALFIRWYLDPASPEDKSKRAVPGAALADRYCHAEALWNYVKRASTEPATPALFEACFGQTYAEAEARLRLYQLAATSPFNNFRLYPAQPLVVPDIQLREATVAEISRLKGRLDRLDIPYVRSAYPALTDRYIEQARRTLRKSYAAGDRDPRLLAELGLGEVDAGDPAAARPYLIAAARGHVVHPRVYYELVRMDYHDFQAAHGNAKVPADLTARWLDLLAEGLAQAPAMPENYLLLAKILMGTTAPVTPPQWALLNAGLKTFPRQPGLYYAAALVCALHGEPDKAQTLVAHILPLAAPEERVQLLHLQEALNGEAKPRG
jgi:hypothetical protein